MLISFNFSYLENLFVVFYSSLHLYLATGHSPRDHTRTLLCSNPSQVTKAHIMQQCRTQCNVDFFDLVHMNDHQMSFNQYNHMGSPICSHKCVIRVRVTELVEPALVL